MTFFIQSSESDLSLHQSKSVESTWLFGLSRAGHCPREMAREALRTLSQKQRWWLHPRQYILSQPPSHQQRENNIHTAHIKLKH